MDTVESSVSTLTLIYTSGTPRTLNTLLMMTQLALTATAEVIRMRAMALSVFALLRAQQVTNNNGLLSPMRARR